MGPALFFFGGLGASAIWIALASFVTAIKPWSKPKQLFSIICLFFALWAFGFAFVVVAPDKSSAWFWYRFSSIGWLISPAVLYRFFRSLTLERPDERLHPAYLLYVIAAAFVLRSMTGMVAATDFVRTPYGWDEVIPVSNVWTYLYLAYFLSCTLLGLLHVHRWGTRSSNWRERKQATITVWVGVATVAMATVANILLRHLGVHQFPGLAPLLLPIWGVAIFYAIVRYSMLELNPAMAAQRILETTVDGVLLLDPSSRIVTANPAAEHLLGRDRQQMTGLAIGELLGEDGLFQRQDLYQTLCRAPILHHQISLRRGNDDLVVSLSASAVTDEGDIPAGVVLILRDITERVAAQEALLASETKFLNMVLNSPDAVLIQADDGEVTYASPQTAKVLGRPPDSILGRRLFDFIHQDDAGRVRDGFLAARSGAEFGEHEYRVIGEHEETRWVSHTARRHSVGTSFVHIQSTIRDITERKHLQTQIAQADRVSSMGMLAAGVAHEINNPLLYLLHNLEEVAHDLPEVLDAARPSQGRRQDAGGPEGLDGVANDSRGAISQAALSDIRGRLDDALAGAKRIRDITRALRTFSRVERDQLVPVDLTHVIEVAANMASNELTYRARVVKDYGEVPQVMASEGRLSQVFLNLLINAAHAIEEGNVNDNEVRIRTWTEGDDVCVEVRDTGKGIEPAHLERLFDPFFTTKEIGMGSGLGLAVSRSIIVGCGGRIDVESKVGKGASFVVRIPIRQEQPVAEVHGPAAKDTEPEVRGRILVIDDDRGVRSALVSMLRAHDVVQAASGEVARAILEGDQDFDVIICDMMMPQVSGMDLHQWLAADHPSLAARLIFITGGAFTPQAREYLKGLDSLCLEKPFDVQDVTMIVRDQILASPRGKK